MSETEQIRELAEKLWTDHKATFIDHITSVVHAIIIGEPFESKADESFWVTPRKGIVMKKKAKAKKVKKAPKKK